MGHDMKAQYIHRVLLMLLFAGAILAVLFALTRVQMLPVRIVLGLLLVPLVFSFLSVVLDTIALPLRVRGDSRFGRLVSRALSPVYSAAIRCLGLVGIPAPRIHRFFIRLNNDAVRRHVAATRKRNVTILLPFCLQGRRCSVYLDGDASNCKVCGMCQIGELVEIVKGADVNLRIAPRSELAPAIVRETTTDLAIAIACLEKLAKGVIWTYYCPCFCIEASSDGQSCLEPAVDLSIVKEAVESFGIVEAG